MPVQINTCRFCHEYTTRPNELVKYGTRHYAHHACYLDAGKTLDTLKPLEVGQFPWKLLRDRGLMADAERILKRVEG